MVRFTLKYCSAAVVKGDTNDRLNSLHLQLWLKIRTQYGEFYYLQSWHIKPMSYILPYRHCVHIIIIFHRQKEAGTLK